MRTVISLLLVVVLPAAFIGAETRGIGAMMQTAGPHVVVNSVSVEGDIAILAGDKISVGDNSAANLTVPGSSVSLGENTSATFRGDALVLEIGSMTVATTSALKSESGPVEVKPISKNAQFAVSRDSEGVTIIARKGDLLLAGDTMLREGEVATIADPQTGPQPEPAGKLPPSDDNSKKKKIAIIILAGAAAAALIIAFEEQGHHHPVTPVRPH